MVVRLVRLEHTWPTVTCPLITQPVASPLQTISILLFNDSFSLYSLQGFADYSTFLCFISKGLSRHLVQDWSIFWTVLKANYCLGPYFLLRSKISEPHHHNVPEGTNVRIVLQEVPSTPQSTWWSQPHENIRKNETYLKCHPHKI